METPRCKLRVPYIVVNTMEPWKSMEFHGRPNAILMGPLDFHVEFMDLAWN